MPLGANIPGGVSPLTRQGASARPAGEHLRERILDLADLDPEQVRAMLIPIFVTLGPTTLSAYDKYRVPTTHDFVIERILPHIVLLDVGNALEIANDANASIPLPTFADRILARANNVLLELKNEDREAKLIDNHPLVLSSLMPPLGGDDIDLFALPHKVPAGETLRLDARFATSTYAGQLGANAQYGLVLAGKLVRIARS
jgi:hypothetical protein